MTPVAHVASALGDEPPLAEPWSASDHCRFSLRGVLTGMGLGALFCLCNLYAGLKVGWSLNVSLAAVLLTVGAWRGLHRLSGISPLGATAANLSQTAASAGAFVPSAGLSAAIPALALMTGQRLAWWELSLWLFSVCLVGGAVAALVRHQWIVVERLPFAWGMASAATLREISSRSTETWTRVRVLLAGAGTACLTKLIEHVLRLPRIPLWGAMHVSVSTASGAVVPLTVPLQRLTFALDPTLLGIGVGALIGLRAGYSMLVGAVLAWGFLAPQVLARGWLTTPAHDWPVTGSWYAQLLPWLVWPGAVGMVVASLSSCVLSWGTFALRPHRRSPPGPLSQPALPARANRRWLLLALLGASAASVVLQGYLFGTGPGLAALGIAASVGLVIVAARVSGETALTPNGAMAKVTQLVVGITAPGQPSANLMAAGVTSGAAAQGAGLLHDLKAGHLLGTSPASQMLAQVLGAMTGALVGGGAYLVLVANPATDLLNDRWPAPAAAAWKAVAEILAQGVTHLPRHCGLAMVVAGVVGLGLIALERTVPPPWRRFVPNAACVGLGFVLPAYSSMSLCLGGFLALAVSRWAPRWAEQHSVLLASGLVAGESLAGVSLALAYVFVGRV